MVEGRLQKLKKRSGILVNLVGGAKGVVCLTDLYDDYQNDPLSNYHQGQHLKCYVIDLGPKQTYQLSLRRSRLEWSYYLNTLLFDKVLHVGEIYHIFSVM